jgi:hypothetical protein
LLNRGRGQQQITVKHVTVNADQAVAAQEKLYVHIEAYRLAGIPLASRRACPNITPRIAQAVNKRFFCTVPAQ